MVAWVMTAVASATCANPLMLGLEIPMYECFGCGKSHSGYEQCEPTWTDWIMPAFGIGAILFILVLAVGIGLTRLGIL